MRSFATPSRRPVQSSPLCSPPVPPRHRTGRQPRPPAVRAPAGEPLLPAHPGLVTHLRGTDGGEHFKQTVRITARTRAIAGVETTVVRDVVRRPTAASPRRPTTGTPRTRTATSGTSARTPRPTTRTATSRVAPGPGRPASTAPWPGSSCPRTRGRRQAAYMEFAKGEAEDQAWVVQRLPVRCATPGGRREHIVRTLEWTRLEPQRRLDEVLRPRPRHRGGEGHRRRRRALLAGVLRWLRRDEVPSRNHRVS